jgi:O-antigen ligase/tetratricopeptide (TPR) repeat protein
MPAMQPGRAAQRGELTAWLAILPLLLYLTLTGAGASNGVYLQPLRLVSLTLLCVLFAAWTVVALRYPDARPRTSIGIAVAAPLVALTVATLLSARPRIGAESVAYAVILAALYLLLVQVLRRPALASRFFVVLAAVTFAVSIGYVVTVVVAWVRWWGIVGTLTVPPLRPGYAAIMYGAPGILSAFLALAGASSWAGLRTLGSRGAVAGAGVAAAAALAILLAGTRGAWFAVGLGSLAAGVAPLASGARPRFAGVSRIPRSLVVVAGALALAGLVLAPVVLQRFLTGGGERLRSTLFATSIRMFQDRPLSGQGPGSWLIERASYTQPDELDYYIPHGHNVPAQVLAESGLLGAVAAVVVGVVVVRLVWPALRSADRRRQTFAVAAVFAAVYLTAQQLVDSFMDMPAVLFAAVVPVAYLDALAPDRHRPAVARITAVIPVAGLLATLLLLVRIELPALRFDAAVASLARGDARDTMERLESVLSDDPISPYRYLEALALAHAGRVDDARNAFALVAATDDYPQAWLNIAALTLSRGDQPGARDALRRALRLGIQQPAIAIAAGELFLRLSDQRSASAAFAAALSIAPALADDPWFQATPDRRTAWREAVDQVEATDPGIAVPLIAGDTEVARAHAVTAADGGLATLIVDAWQGSTDAQLELEARAVKAPLDYGPVAWLARIATRSGDPGASARYREWAATVGGIPDADIGADTIVTDAPRPGVQVPGPNANSEFLYSYRRPMVWDVLIDGLPKLTMD